MENLQSRVEDLEKSVAALENKIFHVKQALAKNVDLLKQHHENHLKMIEENPNSEYFKGLASDSKFQIELAEMNEHHIINHILLYF